MLGEPLVSGVEILRQPSVDPHAMVLWHQVLAASHECLVLETEPRGIQRHVRWDAPQLHWNASVHALQLIETVQATQHVNTEVHTTLAVEHTDLVCADWSHGPALAVHDATERCS